MLLEVAGGVKAPSPADGQLATENDTSVLLSALADARELCYENA